MEALISFRFISQCLLKQTMFPNVKSKEEKAKDKTKEKDWDEKLGKSMIPQYSPIHDRHTGSYKKSLMGHNTSRGKNSQYDNLKNKQVKGKTFFERKLELIAELKQIHPDYIEEIRSYEDSMNKHSIPNFYSYFQLLPLKKCQDPHGFIHDQTKKLREKSSAYHRISTAIMARDQCLQRLKKTLLKIKEPQILKLKQQLKQEVSHLRMLTANVIDQVKKWRNQLGQIDQKAIYYHDEKKNYLIGLLNDNSFIFNSELSSVINFGEKNDPFILAPLKKAEGKQRSPFLYIFETDKQLSYYEKYMEYLATEKAYELNVSMTKKSPQKSIAKSYSVNKIYGSGGNHSKIEPIDEHKDQGQESRVMEIQKNRQERLKKNQEKINAIKSIYETYASKKGFPKSERKMAETDIEQKMETMRVKKSKNMRQSDDNGFDGMVKLKMDFQKVKAKSKKKKQSVSLKKLPKNQAPKNEDKMIDNLREIQTTLKNKLDLVQRENQKLEQSANFNSSRYKITKKNNEQLMKELKLEIIQKIQKENQEKEKLRKKKKEEEEKALEQIKSKMKKEMEEKLEQKKRQKMMEREELEKRLKEEQQRLNNQREMELQLQLKLHKERQMRELERIRREALEKQKKYKEQLEKQQKLRREREQAIENQKREKEKLLEELKKKQLKQQIQQELKKQMLEKKKIEDEESAKLQLEALKKQKQNELTKQIELLKLKQKDEIAILQKEAAIREKMLILKKDEEELKRKQVEQLMKTVIQKEKEDLDREALEKRVQLEEQMRNSIKQKMLEEYRAERENQIEVTKAKRQKEMEEEIYRQKIKQKIERQLRMDAINKTKKQMDQKQAKKYELRTKLENVKNNIEASHVIDRNQIQSDVKKELIERVIFDKQAQRENAKTALRSQFEKQLLSSALPQIYEPKDSFMVKNTQYLHEDTHLDNTMDKYKPTNQKPDNNQMSGTKKSGIQDVRSLITNEQLQIYSKQKQKISAIQEQRNPEKPKKYEQEEGFELMSKDQKKGGSQDEYDIKIVRKQKPKQQEEDKYEKKKTKKHKKKRDDSEEDSEEERRKKKRKNKKKNKRRHYSDSQSESVDSEDQPKLKKKLKKKIKKVKESSEEQQSERQSPIRKKVQFGTSEQQNKPKRKESKHRKDSSEPIVESETSNKKKAIVHFDATKKSSQKQPNFTQIEPITIKTDRKQKQINPSKFVISLDAIPEGELDEYIESHFSNLPEEQLNILTHNREDLYRKLINQLTFCMLLGHHEGKLIGMALAYHDRTRSDIRKFIIVHLGTYKTDDLKQFLISVTNYIFKKDPCDQIQFHYQFDEQYDSQTQFSTDFNKWFDKYGNVYQKKLENTLFQRKYVLKRQFNQKCDVVLGGINKNTFRNIFSVYSGVMMSDSDMVQFKEELIDVISPEDDVSYAIMIAELFRTYLTPDQAEVLKGKVKEFAKLKELLILVVMLQKKKVKMDELKLFEYKSLIQLNMKLMSQGKDVIRYAKDPGVDLNRVFYCELSHGFNLPFNFQTTSLPVQAKEGKIRQISYFRLAPLPPYKLHIMKSSIYNGQLNVMPTENSKYKLFIMNAQEYMEMRERQQSKLDLFMYIRLFLKNVKSHNVAVWKYVWMPEMTDKGAWNIREFRSFLSKDMYCHDSVNISYRQFLPGALIIQPQHRDLVITPPFIVGIMSMTLQQITQGSPLYARLIDVDALRTIEVEE